MPTQSYSVWVNTTLETPLVSEVANSPNVEPAEGATTEVLRPVAALQRIDLIDILRGFALGGILSVNMALFKFPVDLDFLTGEWGTPGTLDRMASWLIAFACESKFYPLFSLLFGLGFSLQAARARQRGRPFAGFYLRRLGILFVFGIAHGTLLWTGDILAIYAVVGCFLLLYSRVREPRTLLIWSASLIGVMFAIALSLAGLVMLLQLVAPGVIDEVFRDPEELASFEQAEDVYTHGTYWDVTRQRGSELLWGTPWYLLVLGPSVLAMFLVGDYLGRRGALADAEAHLGLFRRMIGYGMAIGLPCNVAYATLSQVSGSWSMSAAVFGWVLVTVGGPAQSLGYVGGIVLLLRSRSVQRVLTWLAPVGRLALTNYLLQSLVCTTIFYGYGLGYFGQVGAAWGLALSLGIYATQIVLSNAWVRYFRYGPAEWLWRSLSYGRVEPR